MALPPPPTGQTGVSPNTFAHLPPPPTGQQGVTLQQIQSQQPQQSLGQKVAGGLGSAFKAFGDLTGATTVGNAIGTAGVAAKEYLTGHPDAGNFIAQSGPSVPQQIGAYGNAALTVAAPVTGGFEGAAKGASLGAKALNLGKNTAINAGLGYVNDVTSGLQNKSAAPFTPGAGTVIGAAIPGTLAVAKLPTAVLGRLLKGLGSGISGVPTKTLDAIIDNPKVAASISKKLAQSGSDSVLEDNVKTFMNGVSQIHSEASNAYSKGLDSLSTVDIKPENLQKGFFDALDKNGVKIGEDGKPDFTNADFLDPKIQAKAENVINTINSQKDLSGAGVRKLMDQVDSAKFKTAPDGDRQAFNAFMGDLKSGLKDGVSQSTDKLDTINKAYSHDMGLSQAIQNIFGKVNYKNLPEVVSASKKLEGLFSKQGLEPGTIDKFFTRVGVNPQDFRTSEAVRQIDNVSEGKNSEGLGVGEIVRAASAAVITPENVKNLAIMTGIAKEKLEPFLKALKPSARNILLQAVSRQNQPTGQLNL